MNAQVILMLQVLELCFEQHCPDEGPLRPSLGSHYLLQPLWTISITNFLFPSLGSFSCNRNCSQRWLKSVVPSLFCTRGQLCGRQFFLWMGWFLDDSSASHVLCTLFLLLLHQLHLRSSGIRSQRLGIPSLNNRRSLLSYVTRSLSRSWVGSVGNATRSYLDQLASFIPSARWPLLP